MTPTLTYQEREYVVLSGKEFNAYYNRSDVVFQRKNLTLAQRVTTAFAAYPNVLVEVVFGDLDPTEEVARLFEVRTDNANRFKMRAVCTGSERGDAWYEVHLPLAQEVTLAKQRLSKLTLLR